MFGIGTTSFSRENLLGAGEPNRDYNGTDSGNHRLNGTPDYNQRTARRVGGAGNTRGSQRKEGSGMTASDFSISTDSSSPHTGAGTKISKNFYLKVCKISPLNEQINHQLIKAVRKWSKV